MNPFRLKLEGFRSYSTLDLEFPAGCVAIQGENGAGKSSLVTAIEVALFGAESRSLAPFLADDGATSMLIQLDLEHDGDVYRVRRSYSSAGRGTAKLDLERYDVVDTDVLGGGGDWSWLPMTQGNAAETQMLIERTLGLTRDTFLASSYLAQGRAGVFVEATASARKQLLARSLQLDVWERGREQLVADGKQQAEVVAGLDGRLAALDERIAAKTGMEAEAATVKASEENATAVLETADGELVTLQARLVELQQHESRLAAVQGAAASARSRLTAHEGLARDAERARDAIDELEVELAALGVAADVAVWEREREDLVRQRAAIAAADDERRRQHGERVAEIERRRRHVMERVSFADSQTTKAASLLEQATHVLDHSSSSTCDRCGQVLGADAAERAAASYRDEAESLQAEARAITEVMAEESTQLAALALELAEPPNVQAELMPIDERIDVLATTIWGEHGKELDRSVRRERLAQQKEIVARTDTDEFRSELGRLQQEAKAAEERHQEVVEGHTPGLAAETERLITLQTDARDRARRELDRWKEGRAVLTSRLEDIAKAENERGAIADQRAMAAADLDDLRVLAQAFGRDGVPAYIIENTAIPHIETEATRILTELGLAWEVELRTERDLKTGGTADTLDVVIVTENGERLYESCSGGERTRVNVALRLALAQLLANRRGADTRIVVLDEPDGLDDEGKRSLTTILREMHERNGLERVYLISHDAGLRDAFDSALLVTKTNGRSEVRAA